MTYGKSDRAAPPTMRSRPMTRFDHDKMTAFLISIGVVALAEIGDKTQLLALALAAKYRKPWPIIFGIFFATLANHFLAGAIGTWLTHAIGPVAMRWGLGLSFPFADRETLADVSRTATTRAGGT